MAGAASAAPSRAGRRHSRILRLFRRAPVRALIGANLVAAIVVLARGAGLLQPLELPIYDALRVAWAGHQPSERVLLVGGSEADVQRWD